VKHHLSVGDGEEGVVPAASDVLAGMKVRAPLAHDDVARPHPFAAISLDAETLGVGIPAVPATAARFLVRHLENLPVQMLDEMLDQPLSSPRYP